MDTKKVLTQLIRLSYLEAGMIACYKTALKEVENKTIRVQVGNFYQDHLEHYEALRQKATELGGVSLFRKSDLTWNEQIVPVSEDCGMVTTLQTLFINEKIINETYEKALLADMPPEIKAQNQSICDDEQDHVNYLDEILSTKMKFVLLDQIGNGLKR